MTLPSFGSFGSDIEVFEESRSTLLGLAYRILGSRADAEDAVQDTFLKWEQARKDAEPIETPASWLMTVCTRRCIDLLRSAHKARVDYVGTWLPEPIATKTEPTSEEHMALASSLTTAFLLLLERLTPKERAAYLLHEIFEISYPEIAKALDMQEAACRKLVSRARTTVDRPEVRHTVPRARQEQLLDAFEGAIVRGDMASLSALLSDDIDLHADGGGKVPTIQQILRGKDAVLAFIGKVVQPSWSANRWVPVDINGGRGVLLEDDGKIVAAMSFAYDESGNLADIFVVRNPDKLARLREEAIE
ncbi:RNA polymerase sigma factor SigJ [Pendulispora rubella]|uniref:RNA polymerase sigma factor SigJ n=1 Tax=Pendulispora rubella TaxID=2741070 RepID=A0ABZ2LHW3_9BACT